MLHESNVEGLDRHPGDTQGPEATEEACCCEMNSPLWMNVCCEVLIQQTCSRFHLHLNHVQTNVHFKQLQFILNQQPHNYNSAVLESEG